MVGEKIGGHVLGAYDGSTLVAFAFGLPGVRDGHAYIHSHMLAVKETLRNTGLGREMKLFQRELAMSEGYDLIEWTFDPLEIKNAYFNLEKLGAVVRRYVVNQYGITSSPLAGRAAERPAGGGVVAALGAGGGDADVREASGDRGCGEG